MRPANDVRHLRMSINRPAREVYDFVSDPKRLPDWASGLGTSVTRAGGDWIAETPEGPMKVHFAEKNQFGVLDHWVTSPAGVENYIPMRVIPNGSHSELLFTLFQPPFMSDAKFAEDAAWVLRDLTALKNLLEAK